MMLTVLVVHTCLLLNAPTLLILIVGVLIVTVMMLLSTAVSLSDICKINNCMSILHLMWMACYDILRTSIVF